MICGLVLERNWPLVSSDSYHIGLRAQEMACHMCPPHWNALCWKGIRYTQERIAATRPLSMKSKRSFVLHTGSVWKRLLPQQTMKTLWELTNVFGACLLTHLFNHSKSDSKGVPPLKRHGNLITNVAGKAIVLNSYFQSVFTSHVPLATSSKSML